MTGLKPLGNTFLLIEDFKLFTSGNLLLLSGDLRIC